MALTKNFVGLQNLMARHPIMAMVGFIGAQIAINGVQHSLPYTSENMVTKHLLAAGMCYTSSFALSVQPFLEKFQISTGLQFLLSWY